MGLLRATVVALGVALLTTAASAAPAAAPLHDTSPRWAADGRWIGFYRGPTPGDNRGFLVPARGGAPRQIGDVGLHWSPDGKWLVTSGGDGRIALGAADGTQRTVVAHGRNPSWSPDGRAFVFASDGYEGLFIFDVQTRMARRLPIDVEPCESCTVSFGPPNWSPDGRAIAVEVTDALPPRLYVVDVTRSRSRVLTTKTRYLDTNPVWSADSRFLAVVEIPDRGLEVGRVIVIRVRDGLVRPVHERYVDIEEPYPFGWSPQGATLAIGAGRPGRRHRLELHQWDRRVRPKVIPRVNDFAWSPDATKLAVVRDGFMSIADTRTGQLTPLVRGVHPDWSPDGREIVYSVGRCTPHSGIHVIRLRDRRDRQLTHPCR